VTLANPCRISAILDELVVSVDLGCSDSYNSAYSTLGFNVVAQRFRPGIASNFTYEESPA
jgi:hypothetical protein